VSGRPRGRARERSVSAPRYTPSSGVPVGPARPPIIGRGVASAPGRKGTKEQRSEPASAAQQSTRGVAAAGCLTRDADRKPSSVPQRLAAPGTAISLGPRLPAGSSNLPATPGCPGDRTGPPHAPQNVRRRCLVLHAVGLAVPRPSPAARCALTAPFHPYLCGAGPGVSPSAGPAIGGVLSVALSLNGSSPTRPVGVTHHRVLSCSDFPRAGRALRPADTRPSRPHPARMLPAAESATRPPPHPSRTRRVDPAPCP